MDFAYWPFNGTQETGYSRTYGAAETYGLLAQDWSGYGSETVMSALRPLQLPAKGPGTGGGSRR
jgi:endoglucanase